MTDWDTSDLLRGLGEAAKKVGFGAMRGAQNWAEHVREESQRLVPIEEGTLQNSARTAAADDGLTVGIGYGSGAAAPYAARQHEDLSLHHDEGRQAKYLEQPLVASGDAGLRIVADSIKGML